MRRLSSLTDCRKAISENIRRTIVAANEKTGYLSTRIPDSSNAVLMYHSVGNPDFSADVPPTKLRSDIEFLVESPAIDVVDLPEVLDCSSAERKVALTFDDGYRNFATTALPILREYDVPATVFLNPAFLDDERRATIEEVHEIDADGRMIMSEYEVSTLVEEPNVVIGNHTNAHARLDELDDESLRDEIVSGKEALESTFDVSVERFCYPYGEYDRRSVEVVKEHHELGVTTYPFVVTPDSSRYELPRLPGNLPVPDMAWEISRLSDVLPVRDERMEPLYPD